MRYGRNPEGYADPTATAAIARIVAEERKAHRKGQRRKRSRRRKSRMVNGGRCGQKL